jgi:2-C-methyl-D-erythritol 4-phosphate cytidylyltransferase / 2-C-methyl-D-erythritol 2,4-cyclodiphosphate synthase
MTCAAIVLAGGAGLRIGPEEGAPAKQYRLLARRPVIAWAVDAFANHPRVDTVQVVARVGTERDYAASIAPHARLRPPVAGGARRQDSARLGLEALAESPPDHVLIHDAARPFVSAALIDRVLAALEHHPAGIPASPVSDTLKRAAPSGLVEATIGREGLYAVQTPQGFRYPAILEAHRRAAGAGMEFTDDAAVAEWNGLEVVLVPGEVSNRKLTTPEDFALAESMFAAGTETRTGFGFDVHRFGPGDHVMLCGVPVEHSYGLAGHSDSDVGLHAITDALLGSIAAGDIGSHFPPSEAKWRHAESSIFLAHARDLVAARGGTIVNVDVTIVCETPKVGPHRDAMRARIADILDIAVARVAVKATTSEGLGFAGRGEGMAAHAVATVVLPVAEDVP